MSGAVERYLRTARAGDVVFMRCTRALSHEARTGLIAELNRMVEGTGVCIVLLGHDIELAEKPARAVAE